MLLRVHVSSSVSFCRVASSLGFPDGLAARCGLLQCLHNLLVLFLHL